MTHASVEFEWDLSIMLPGEKKKTSTTLSSYLIYFI